MVIKVDHVGSEVTPFKGNTPQAQLHPVYNGNIITYSPYGSKYLLGKYFGYDFGVKYLLRHCLDP